MGNFISRRAVIVTALLLGAALVWWGQRSAPKNPSLRAGAVQAAAPATEPEAACLRRLSSALAELQTAKNANERSAALSRLQTALASGPASDTARAIRDFLEAKADARTGLGFKLGKGGTLSEAPTLRTLLLDQLARLDPAAAAAYARVILETSSSPDEWAIALRDLARGDSSPEARALLERKTGELLRNEAWQSDPSAGYLEAFDTAVALGGTKLLPPLAELVTKQDNQAVAHAAFLTLDRLVLQQPAETLTVLLEHPDWMQGREETRANYFARADMSDSGQRRLVEAYLLNAARSPVELAAFVGVFPNANFMLSQNLLTTDATPDGAALRRRDRAALEAVNQWIEDPRFAAMRTPLLQLQQRLENFVRQAETNP